MGADAYARCVGVDCRRTAFLNLVADATHNFTDGLAIGVAFGRGEHEVATTLGKAWDHYCHGACIGSHAPMLLVCLTVRTYDVVHTGHVISNCDACGSMNSCLAARASARSGRRRNTHCCRLPSIACGQDAVLHGPRRHARHRCWIAVGHLFFCSI